MIEKDDPGFVSKSQCRFRQSSEHTEEFYIKINKVINKESARGHKLNVSFFKGTCYTIFCRIPLYIGGNIWEES